MHVAAYVYGVVRGAMAPAARAAAPTRLENVVGVGVAMRVMNVPSYVLRVDPRGWGLF